MNIWVVKTREHRDIDAEGWHWNNYFSSNETPWNWGGDDWIKNAYSRILIRDVVRRDDLVVCYQTDGRQIVGLTRMNSAGKKELPESGNYTVFDLVSADEAFHLESPLLIPELYAFGSRPFCFRSGKQGTVFPLQDHEFSAIVAAIIHYDHASEKDIRTWLHGAGWRWKFPRKVRTWTKQAAILE